MRVAFVSIAALATSLLVLNCRPAKEAGVIIETKDQTGLAFLEKYRSGVMPDEFVEFLKCAGVSKPLAFNVTEISRQSSGVQFLVLQPDGCGQAEARLWVCAVNFYWFARRLKQTSEGALMLMSLDDSDARDASAEMRLRMYWEAFSRDLSPGIPPQIFVIIDQHDRR